MTRRVRLLAPTTAALFIAAATVTRAETRPIDTAQSKLTVFVYKSGLFSGLADDHVIDAPIASGSVSDTPPLSVAIEVHAGDMKVRDPNLSASKRDEVQTRMMGPQVLDTMKFQSVTFESTAVEPNGTERWNVIGRLTIHGQTRPVTVLTTRANGRYRGMVLLKQRDFGISPISLVGGTIKIKSKAAIADFFHQRFFLYL